MEEKPSNWLFPAGKTAGPAALNPTNNVVQDIRALNCTNKIISTSEVS